MLANMLGKTDSLDYSLLCMRYLEAAAFSDLECLWKQPLMDYEDTLPDCCCPTGAKLLRMGRGRCRES